MKKVPPELYPKPYSVFPPMNFKYLEESYYTNLQNNLSFHKKHLKSDIQSQHLIYHTLQNFECFMIMIADVLSVSLKMILFKDEPECVACGVARLHETAEIILGWTYDIILREFLCKRYDCPDTHNVEPSG